MEVKVQNEPWCEMCPFVDLIVDKDLSYADNELAGVDLYAQCRNLKQCRGAIKRAKALEEQALAKWWEGLRVAPCGKEAHETLHHMPDLNEPHPLRRVDRLRYLTPKGIIKALHLTRICPPYKACENIPHGHEPYPDCEQFWISWMWGRDDLPDGDSDA